MAQQENDAHIQMQSELMGEKEALKQELESKMNLVEEITAKIIQLNEELEKAKKEIEAPKDVISSLKKELQKRDLEKVKKGGGTGDEGSPGKEKCGLDKTSVVEGCESPVKDDNKVVIVKEEKQGEEGPTRKLLTEAVLSRTDPSLSREEEQLLLPEGRGSVVVSKSDVTVQTDEDTEIEDLRLKNENMAKELANKQAVIESQENQLATYYQSILELKAKLKMAQQKNDAHIQMQSELMGEKEALKRELEGKVILVEENTAKMVQLNEELEKAKKEIEAHDELKSIFLAENEDLKKSNEERSFLNKELALEKIKLEKEPMEARSNDQKRSQGHQRLVEELQGEISKALVLKRELKEAVFTITKKNEGFREQLENKHLTTTSSHIGDPQSDQPPTALFRPPLCPTLDMIPSTDPASATHTALLILLPFTNREAFASF
ncbi:myosin-11-like [Palaemon carinicauda]|uniref:myosin-11-like n=1 Tax=Palaemon carinicauda TaxID=392227 RepID=UPI0035B5E38B